MALAFRYHTKTNILFVSFSAWSRKTGHRSSCLKKYSWSERKKSAHLKTPNMFNNVALDVVIGLVFVFLLYSLLLTIILEFIASRLSFRAKFLEKAIFRMLEDDDARQPNSLAVKLGIHINSLSDTEMKSRAFFRTFYDHPLIKYLGEKPSRSKPSYLVSETFSKVVVDILRGDKLEPGQEIRSGIQESLNTGMISWNKQPDKKAKPANPSHDIQPQTLLFLKSLWGDAQGDVEEFKGLLQNWFNETMDRTTGWYKKYTQFVSLFVGLLIAIIFNVDTIAIAHKLEKDPKLREQIVQQADAYIKAHPNMDTEIAREKQQAIQQLDTTRDIVLQKDSIEKKVSEDYTALKRTGDSLVKRASALIENDIEKTNGILGMGIGSFRWSNFLTSWLGWLLTALALSLGAPFWFDLLNKLMKLRNSVPPSSDNAPVKTTGASGSKIKRVG